MGLRGFERRLENAVEGVFARAFRSGVRPVEIGRRVERVLDDERTVDVRGRTVVPNEFRVQLSELDHERYADVQDVLERELAETVRARARERGYSFLGPVSVAILSQPQLRTGRFQVGGRMSEGPGGTGAGSLVLPDGTRYPLGDRPVRMGRQADCDLLIDEPNASRHHAEIRPDGDGYLLTDLGSTNGTKVNDTLIDRYRLRDGDVVTIGSRHMRFEAL